MAILKTWVNVKSSWRAAEALGLGREGCVWGFFLQKSGVGGWFTSARAKLQEEVKRNRQFISTWREKEIYICNYHDQ